MFIIKRIKAWIKSINMKFLHIPTTSVMNKWIGSFIFIIYIHDIIKYKTLFIIHFLK